MAHDDDDDDADADRDGATDADADTDETAWAGVDGSDVCCPCCTAHLHREKNLK